VRQRDTPPGWAWATTTRLRAYRVHRNGPSGLDWFSPSSSRVLCPSVERKYDRQPGATLIAEAAGDGEHVDAVVADLHRQRVGVRMCRDRQEPVRPAVPPGCGRR